MERFYGWSGAILLVGFLLCSPLSGAIGVVAADDAGETQPPARTEAGDIETETFEADRTVFVITIGDNGSAEWRFRYEQRLENDTDVEDFETYADRFNSEETDGFRNFRDRAIALTDSGTETTGRNMTAVRFRRDARIEERPPAGDEFGVIEMSFGWTGFAVTEENKVIVGDVFVGGLYVGSDQQLRFERGPNIQFESTAPPPDSTAAETLSESESITWLGEKSFTDRQPRIVLVDRRSNTSQSEAGANTSSSETDPEPTPDMTDTNESVVPISAAAIAIALGLSAAFVYRAGLLTTDTIGDGSPPSPSSETPSEQTTEPEAISQSDAEAVAETTATATTEIDGPPDEACSKITDAELFSDEERVITLLEAQDGRMKQVDIVDQTDWSKSKVSMLLSDMESEGTISKLRVGRENIVSLAGHEPDAAGSPFDEE